MSQYISHKEELFLFFLHKNHTLFSSPELSDSLLLHKKERWERSRDLRCVDCVERLASSFGLCQGWAVKPRAEGAIVRLLVQRPFTFTGSISSRRARENRKVFCKKKKMQFARLHLYFTMASNRAPLLSWPGTTRSLARAFSIGAASAAAARVAMVFATSVRYRGQPRATRTTPFCVPFFRQGGANGTVRRVCDVCVPDESLSSQKVVGCCIGRSTGSCRKQKLCCLQKIGPKLTGWS